VATSRVLFVKGAWRMSRRSLSVKAAQAGGRAMCAAAGDVYLCGIVFVVIILAYIRAFCLRRRIYYRSKESVGVCLELYSFLLFNGDATWCSCYDVT